MRRGIAACLLFVAALTAQDAHPALGSHARADVSLAQGWLRIPMTAPGLVRDRPLEILAGGPGLLVYSPPPTSGLPGSLWSSADGRLWKSVPLPSIQPDEGPGRLFAASGLLIITGCGQCETPGGQVSRIWASKDGGATWQRSPASLQITALTAGGDGVIGFAVNREGLLPSTSVWTSADGLSWRLLSEASAVFDSAEVTAVAQGEPGLVAVGDIQVPGALGGELAAIWTSKDGLSWSQVPNDDAIFGDLSDGMHTGIEIRQAVAGAQGVLALGDTFFPSAQSHAVAWSSQDGVHWRRSDGVPFNPYGDVRETRLVAWQGGFVGLNDEGGEMVVWSSTDGLTWNRMGSDELFGGTARVFSATGFRGGVVAVGSFAPHPRSACLTDPRAVNYSLTFRSAVLLWSPDASRLASPPRLDRSDPRLLKLRPSDFPPGLQVSVYADLGYEGAYTNLCPAVPSLGRHRAYLQSFLSLVGGEALIAAAGSVAAARAAFRHADRLFEGDRVHELRAGIRIGQETRAFRIRREFMEVDGGYYQNFGVVWREGRVIGGVLSTPFIAPCSGGLAPPPVACTEGPGLKLDIELARKQLAHLRDVSG